MKQLLIFLFSLLPLSAMAQDSIIKYLKSMMYNVDSCRFVNSISICKDRNDPKITYKEEICRMELDRITLKQNIEKGMENAVKEEFFKATRADHYRSVWRDSVYYTLIYDWPENYKISHDRPRTWRFGDHDFDDLEVQGIAFLDITTDFAAMFALKSEQYKLAAPATNIDFTPVSEYVEMLKKHFKYSQVSVSYSSDVNTTSIIFMGNPTKERATTGVRYTFENASQCDYQAMKDFLKGCMNEKYTSVYTEYKSMTFLDKEFPDEGYGVSFDEKNSRLVVLHYKGRDNALFIPICWPTCSIYDNGVKEGYMCKDYYDVHSNFDITKRIYVPSKEK